MKSKTESNYTSMASHKWKARVIVKNFLGVDYQLKLQLHCWLSDSTSLNT